MRTSSFPHPGETPQDYRRRRYVEQLAEWRTMGFVVGVEIRATRDCCPACMDWQGSYPLQDAPRNPPEICSQHWRCLADVSPIFNRDPTMRPWHDVADDIPG